MTMDGRKLRVLSAIVQTYIATGEPVGSKAISAMLDNAVSSATIRNDMAELERQGLLEQPHTSAGRIPTHLGYRVYIDNLLEKQPLSQKEKKTIDTMLASPPESAEQLLEQAGSALAEFTHCAAISTTPTPERTVISRIDMIPAAPRIYVMLVITSSGLMKSCLYRSDFEISDRDFLAFRTFIEEKLVGKECESLSPAAVQRLGAALGENWLTLSPLLFRLCELIGELMEGEVILEGQTNLLGYKELHDSGEGLLRFLSRSGNLFGLLNPKTEGVRVLIGSELNRSELNQSSMLLTKYRIGSKAYGHLGIIGPTRIDYARLIPSLEYFAGKMGSLLAGYYEETERKDDTDQ